MACRDLQGSRAIVLAVVLVGSFIVMAFYINRRDAGHQEHGQFYNDNVGQVLYNKMAAPSPPQAQPVGVGNEVNPIPSEAALNAMGVGPLSDLFHGYAHSTQALCNRVTRMGRIGDGGWDICADPLYRPDPKNCLVYSLGIADDWCYDDAIEKYGCEVHSYDPSMTKVQDHVRGQRVHFHQVGIGGVDVEKQPGKWALFTLATLRKKNGHEPEKRRVDIVKMDVEGAEYASLLKAIEEGSLKDVRQLSFEIHMYSSDSDPQKKLLLKMLTIMRRLWDLGFRLYKTTRNSSPVNLYISKIHGVERTAATEVNFVNVLNRG